MSTRLVRVAAAYRLVLAVLLAVALAYSAYQAVSDHRGLGNFFSFFTIESNLLGLVVFTWGGVSPRRGAPDLLRGAVVVYLVITGVVYAILLAGLPNQGIAPWANTVLHRVTPIAVVVDWVLVAPRGPLPLRRVWWWLAFPLAYIAYTLARGPFAHWYPYPFLDPRPHGYARVALGSAGIAVGFVVVTLLVWWVGSALARRTVTATPEPVPAPPRRPRRTPSP